MDRSCAEVKARIDGALTEVAGERRMVAVGHAATDTTEHLDLCSACLGAYSKHVATEQSTNPSFIAFAKEGLGAVDHDIVSQLIRYEREVWREQGLAEAFSIAERDTYRTEVGVINIEVTKGKEFDIRVVKRDTGESILLRGTEGTEAGPDNPRFQLDQHNCTIESATTLFRALSAATPELKRLVVRGPA